MTKPTHYVCHSSICKTACGLKGVESAATEHWLVTCGNCQRTKAWTRHWNPRCPVPRMTMRQFAARESRQSRKPTRVIHHDRRFIIHERIGFAILRPDFKVKLRKVEARKR
jgi:hypothetical protein